MRGAEVYPHVVGAHPIDRGGHEPLHARDLDRRCAIDGERDERTRVRGEVLVERRGRRERDEHARRADPGEFSKRRSEGEPERVLAARAHLGLRRQERPIAERRGELRGRSDAVAEGVEGARDLRGGERDAAVAHLRRDADPSQRRGGLLGARGLRRQRHRVASREREEDQNPKDHESPMRGPPKALH